jgi:hypothetical protein
VGFLDRLFGAAGDEPERPRERVLGAPRSDDDRQAIERYRYLLRTAPPETIEEAHAEAFAQLTPEQRRMVLEDLLREAPEHERAGGYEDDPRSLARLATRAEMRQPGTLERSFSGMSARGFGPPGSFAGSFLGVVAGLLVGSAIAEQFFGDEGSAEASTDAGVAEDSGGDFGGGDFGDFGF